MLPTNFLDLSYQRYLESVIESVGDFGEVKDLISRYDTLSATNQELVERARQAQEQTEKDRVAFLLSTEEGMYLLMQGTILCLTSTISLRSSKQSWKKRSEKVRNGKASGIRLSRVQQARLCYLAKSKCRISTETGRLTIYFRSLNHILTTA